jgi:hypothetical protein
LEVNDHGLTVVVSRNFSTGNDEINRRTLSTAGVPAEARTRHRPNTDRSATGTKKKEVLKGWLEALPKYLIVMGTETGKTLHQIMHTAGGYTQESSYVISTTTVTITCL